ncbi:MAG: hypothetical protein IPH42_20585 [Bacteroidetes bacterium]|nr:hypothetical protein [Bacteroidota bacterium]
MFDINFFVKGMNIMPHYFHETIYQLRANEEIILYDNLLYFKGDDEALVKEFLQIEFDVESENHPFSTPKTMQNRLYGQQK